MQCSAFPESRDSPQSVQGVRIRSRIFDQALPVVHEDEWTAELPPNGRACESHQVQWPIPANTPEGYLFLELSLRDAQGVCVSQRVYWLRILHMLADPDGRNWNAPIIELRP